LSRRNPANASSGQVLVHQGLRCASVADGSYQWPRNLACPGAPTSASPSGRASPCASSYRPHRAGGAARSPGGRRPPAARWAPGGRATSYSCLYAINLWRLRRRRR
jgi:hypothetical protein